MNNDYEALDFNSMELDGDNTSNFTLIPEGEYFFQIAKYERKQTPKRGTVPECMRVYVTFIILNNDEEKVGQITNDYPMIRMYIAKFNILFAAVGLLHKGEKLLPDWPSLIGCKGRCKVTIRNWKDKNQNERQSNGITLLLPDESNGPDVFEQAISANKMAAKPESDNW